MLLTKQLKQLSWTLNLHKCFKNDEEKKRYSKTQNKLKKEKLEKLNDFLLIVQGNIKPNNVPLQ